MECVVIRSKLIASAAYYGSAKRLCIWFHNGRCAVHENVEESVFRNLASAESPGLYYSYYVRGRTRMAPPKVPLSRRVGVAALLSLGMIFASGVSEAGRSSLSSAELSVGR